MNSPATDISTILDDSSIGTFAGTTGWSVYVDREPENPDTVITVFDYAGVPIDDLCTAKNESFRVQVRVRANLYTDAYSKFLEIQNVLDNYSHETIGDTYYNVIYRLDLISSLGKDEKDRSILVQNYAGLRKQILD